MITSLSDSYPYLLTNAKSLVDLQEKTRIDIDMKRFRPNMVISSDAAFEEDNWKKLLVG